MATAATPPPEGRKTLTWVLLAIVLLFVIYFVYRCSKTRRPDVEPAPTPAATATGTATAAPTATPTPTPVCLPPPPTPLPQCKNWIIYVGPGPTQLSADPICVRSNNTINWFPKPGSTGLDIFFPTSGFPSNVSTSIPPFLAMHRVTNSGTDEWRFNSLGPPIFSGTPNPAFGSPGQMYCIKYWQTINGQTADGRIIIQR